MKTQLTIAFILFSVCCFAQELGANFNHNAENINFKYLKKSGVDWVRSTPRILDYVDGTLTLINDPAMDSLTKAGKMGYKIAFGYRWDFKAKGLRIPLPNSKEEKEMFKMAEKLLNKMAPYVEVFKLGNEPNLETLPKDMQPDENGVIPLVRFTQRLLEKVVEPYYKEHTQYKKPDIYVGSFPALFEKKQQSIPAVPAMIRFAQNSDKITGLSVHLHIADISEINVALNYVRSIMPEKPIIVPEFSLFRLYNSKLTEKLGVNQEGIDFAKKYGRNPEWKLYEWFTVANTKGVTSQEWEAMFATRDWFPQHYLKIYYDRFEKYGIVLATFPLLQQSCPRHMTPKSPTWFINPIYCQKSLKRENGEIAENPLCYDDFVELTKLGRNKAKK